MLVALLTTLLALFTVCSSQITIVPLSNNASVTVQSCSVAYYQWTVPSSPQGWYLKIVLNQNASALPTEPLNMYLLDRVPDGTPPNSTACTDFGSRCTAQGPLYTCTITRACGDLSGNYYIAVESAGASQTFSVAASVVQLPTINVLTIYNSQSGRPTFVTGGTLLTTDDRFDYFSLDLSGVQTNITDGTRLIVAFSTPVKWYLKYGSSPAVSPSYTVSRLNCYHSTGTSSSIEMEACVVRQGGTWSIAVERTVDAFTYSALAYTSAPTIVDYTTLGSENFLSLAVASDNVYLKLPAGLVAASTRLVAAVDNIVGGRVQLTTSYKRLDATGGCATDNFVVKSCSSHAGCFTEHLPCEVTQASDPWYVSIKALSIQSADVPVTFTVSVFTTPIQATGISYGPEYVGRAKYARTQHFTLPTPTGNQFVYIRVYTDASLSTSDLNLYVGPSYTGSGSCYYHFKTCTATLSSSTSVRSCSIQLDPCELANYPNGIFVGVEGDISRTDFYYFQENGVPFTLSAEKVDPNAQPSVIDPNDLIQSHVANSQVRMYRVGEWEGTMSVTLTAGIANQAQTPQSHALSMLVFFGNPQGPSCPCWNSPAPTTFQIGGNSGPSVTYSLGRCDSRVSKGIYIAVAGNRAFFGGQYYYEETEYTLSFVTTTAVVDTVGPVKISPGKSMKSNMNDKDNLLIYELTVPSRTGLLSSMIYTRWETQACASVSASLGYAAAGTSGPLSCNAPTYIFGANNLDGEYYHAVGGCQIFNSDTDGRRLLARMNYLGVNCGGLSSTLGVPVSFYYFFDRNTPTQIAADGSPNVGTLPIGVYQHFNVGISAADALKKSLVIEAYFDYAMTNARPTNGVSFYFNSPTTNKPAGEPNDCMCYETRTTGEKKKITYIVNPCELKAGNYHFSLRETGLTTAYFPLKYTLKVTLVDPVVNSLTQSFPYDDKSFSGVPKYYQISIPTAFTGTDETNTDRELFVRVITEDSTTTLGVQLSQSQGVVCGCDGDATSYPFNSFGNCGYDLDGRYFCTARFGYCQLSSGNWYLRVSTLSARTDEVPYTVYVTTRNSHPLNPNTLTASSTCLVAARDPVKVVSVVDDTMYQHFKVSAAGSQSTLYVYLENIVGGTADVFISDNLLATESCYNASIFCNTATCITSAACGNAVKYISVRGNSVGPDPVSFTISTCVVPGSLVLGTPQPGIPINTGETVSRSFSLASVSSVPALFASVDFGTTFATGVLSILRSSCASCPSTIAPFTTVCNGGSTTCTIQREPCVVPQDYATGLWLVTFTSSTAGQITFSLVVGAPTLPPTPTPITGVPTPIPAGVYGLFSYTVPTPFDPVSVTSLSVSSSGSPVYFTFGTSLNGLACFSSSGIIAFSTSRNIGPVSSGANCCSPPGQYLVAVFNPSTTTQTITITPSVTNRTTYLQEGDYPLTTTLSVSLTPSSSGQLVRVKNFPGFYTLNLDDHFAFMLTPTAAPAQNVQVYLGRTALTGNGACSDFFSSTNTLILAGSTSPTYIVAPEISNQCDNDVNPVIAGDFYLAFYNPTFSSTVGVDIKIVKTSVNTLTIGTPYSGTFSYSGERQIFKITVPTNILTSLVVDIQNSTFTSTFSGQVYLNSDVRRVGQNCNTYANFVSNFVTPQVLSCTNFFGPASTGTVVLSIQANGIVLSPSYTINTTVVTAPSTPTTSGTQNSANLLGGIAAFYTYTTPATLSTGSYVSLVLSNITGSGSIGVYPDGQCGGMTVNNDCTSGTACSAIIYPCDLKPSTTYYISISTPTASNPVFTATLVQKAHTILGRNAQLIDSVNPYGLSIYEIPLNPAETTTGTTLSVIASGISCGNVRISTNNANQLSCATAPSLTTLMTPASGQSTIISNSNFCNLGTSGHSLFVTVRGMYSLVSASTPIRFKLTTSSERAPTFRTLQPEEVGVVNYVPSAPVTSSCVAQTAIPGAPQCCPSTTSTSSGNLEKVWWTYSFEGSQFLDFQNQLTFSTYGYISSFTVYTSYSSACQAIATPTNCNGVCTISIQPCSFWTTGTEVRQLFIYIDPASVSYYSTPTFGANVSSIPVIQISNSRKKPQVISLSVTGPTYYLVTLAHQETQFVRIPKPAALANFDGRLSLDVVAVTSGGALTISNTWDICTNGLPSLCSIGTCDDRLAASGGCGSSVGACSCTDRIQACNSRFVQGTDLYYQLRANVFSGGITLVKALVSVSITAPSSPLDPAKCYDFPTTVTDFQFYSHGLAAPTAEQVYNFILNDQTPASASSLALRLGKGSLPGETCSTVSASASGRNFRFLPVGGTESPMYLSVLNNLGSTRYYTLESSLVTVPVKTLTSGVEMSSPSTLENPGCSSTTYNNYYKFTAAGNANGYLLVEFYASGANVYAGKGQVFTEATSTSCTTASYCFFVIGCSSGSSLDYSAGTYYFYVPTNSVHRIKVTEGTATIVQHTAGTPLSVQIPAVGAITTVQVTPPAAQAQTRFNFDTTFPTQTPPVVYWTNRGKFGDSRCSINLGASFSTTAVSTLASQCLVSTSDTLFISFLGTSNLACVSGTRNTFTVNLRSSPITPAALYTTVAADSSVTPQTILGGRTYRETRTVTGLDDDSALFVRLVAPEIAGLTATISKGAHSKTDSNYPLPCAFDCAVTTSSGVALQDKCWHCGNNTYSNFVADIQTNFPTFSGAPDAKYSLFMTAKKYTPLTGTPQTGTLGAMLIDVGLYSATVTTGRIELRVTSGQVVLVRVLPSDCALRTNSISMSCYPGAPCILPIPNMENTGSQQRGGGAPSVLNSNNKQLLVQVIGNDATYTIAHITGSAMCTPVTSGFCNGIVPNGFGTAESIAQKDNFAQTQYSTLVNAFSCPSSSCNCKPATAQCTAAIKAFVCADVYRPCATVGGVTVGQPSTYQQCTSVQTACGAKFSDLSGLATYDCEHNGIPGQNPVTTNTAVVTVLPPPVAGITVFASSHVISVSLFVLVSAIVCFLL